MSETMSEILTIVFSGLMVFHENEREQSMEIGILMEPTHIPRIVTITNGVAAAVLDLRTRPELGDPNKRNWRLEITNPTRRGITTYNNGRDFDRLRHEDPRDFRWGMDLEGKDFYDRELTEMVTKRLMPILQVPAGEFYTRLKSKSLARSEDEGEFKEFGAVAGYTGCDISIDGGSVSLKIDDTDIFTFKKLGEPLTANTIFLIENTPPDVSPHPHPSHHDHFQFYYKLFDERTTPKPRFEFRAFDDPDPGPDPRLCGRTTLGLRKDEL